MTLFSMWTINYLEETKLPALLKAYRVFWLAIWKKAHLRKTLFFNHLGSGDNVGKWYPLYFFLYQEWMLSQIYGGPIKLALMKIATYILGIKIDNKKILYFYLLIVLQSRDL